jgi:hypothetical protein
MLTNRPNSLPSVTGEGDWRAERNAFIWTIDTIDSENPTGSLEFKCEGDADAFFPVNVGFVAAGSLADVDVSPPSRREMGTDVRYLKLLCLKGVILLSRRRRY